DRIYGLLGAMAVGEGDLAKARRYTEKALAVNERFVEAMSNMGMIALLAGDKDEAQRWYQKAMAADPVFPHVHRRLADLFYERGEFGKALFHYRKALDRLRDDFASLIQAGNSARRT